MSAVTLGRRLLGIDDVPARVAAAAAHLHRPAGRGRRVLVVGCGAGVGASTTAVLLGRALASFDLPAALLSVTGDDAAVTTGLPAVGPPPTALLDRLRRSPQAPDDWSRLAPSPAGTPTLRVVTGGGAGRCTAELSAQLRRFHVGTVIDAGAATLPPLGTGDVDVVVVVTGPPPVDEVAVAGRLTELAARGLADTPILLLTRATSRRTSDAAIDDQPLQLPLRNGAAGTLPTDPALGRPGWRLADTGEGARVAALELAAHLIHANGDPR